MSSHAIYIQQCVRLFPEKGLETVYKPSIVESRHAILMVSDAPACRRSVGRPIFGDRCMANAVQCPVPRRKP